MKHLSTKRAWLMSVLSLVLCVAMLAGSTFAWFTDTASTGVNTIQAGNLDVQLMNADGTKELGETPLTWVKATGAENETVWWEPGCTYDLESFRIRNNGNLALKYKVIINGMNPIEAHEFLGNSVEGKDIIIVDDMISSGESVLDIAEQLKEKGARRVFVFATFGLFCNGCAKFDAAYEAGKIDRIFTTNLNYRPDEIINRPWYTEVNMCKYVSYIIDSLNRDRSISELLNPINRIHALTDKVRTGK